MLREQTVSAFDNDERMRKNQNSDGKMLMNHGLPLVVAHMIVALAVASILASCHGKQAVPPKPSGTGQQSNLRMVPTGLTMATTVVKSRDTTHVTIELHNGADTPVAINPAVLYVRSAKWVAPSANMPGVAVRFSGDSLSGGAWDDPLLYGAGYGYQFFLVVSGTSLTVSYALDNRELQTMAGDTLDYARASIALYKPEALTRIGLLVHSPRTRQLRMVRQSPNGRFPQRDRYAVNMFSSDPYAVSELTDSTYRQLLDLSLGRLGQQGSTRTSLAN